MDKIWKDDLYRYTGEKSIESLIFQLLSNHEYRLVFFLRKAKNNMFFKAIYRYCSRKYGIDISPNTIIGPGFYMGHAYAITINSHAKLGKNINIHKGATIGRTNRGKYKGSPIIGNNVFIGINSTIVGGINIGDNVLIAPNSYVNFDVPSNSIVIGNPASIHTNQNATEDYVNWRIE